MFVGGTLIRQFDGFRRLCRRAAEEYRHPLTLSEGDLVFVNRILAALGGPPAASEVRGRFDSDGLPLLLLFLLTQEMEIRAGLLGDASAPLAHLKGLCHLLGQAAYPLVTGRPQLAFQDVVRELGPTGAVLKPLVRYDADGEPLTIDLIGAAGRLGVGPEHGPYTLAVLLDGSGPAPLRQAAGGLHPAVAIAG
ncbi:MAG TPA: hypothetical protein VNT75_07410 [Symbiobacteriaceae bacterium]|nr:hypothetical protein [Symbiobacteriaceae bacterium]